MSGKHVYHHSLSINHALCFSLKVQSCSVLLAEFSYYIIKFQFEKKLVFLFFFFFIRENLNIINPCNVFVRPLSWYKYVIDDRICMAAPLVVFDQLKNWGRRNIYIGLKIIIIQYQSNTFNKVIYKFCCRVKMIGSYVLLLLNYYWCFCLSEDL